MLQAASDRRFAACVIILTVVAGARASNASWQDHALLATFAIASAALAAATGAKAYASCWRPYLVAAYRLFAFWLGMERVVHVNLLSRGPAGGAMGALADGITVLLGTGVVKLVLYGAFLPLELPGHLVVNTLCLLWMAAQAPSRCRLPLLSNEISQHRIGELHEWLGVVGSLGLLPAELSPSGSARCQCAAGIVFAQLLLGWVLPTYMVARADVRRAGDASHAERHGWRTAGAVDGAGQGRFSERNMFHEISSPQGGQRVSRDAQQSCNAGLARWLLRCVFVEGEAADVRSIALYALFSTAWLAFAVTAAALCND